jgi:tetratricopeptide (TPR) repeat protein
MANNPQSDPRDNWMLRLTPWLIAFAMLGVYVLTLNHWVTLGNLLSVSRVSGFLWEPDLYNPLQFLVTLPFRWLPAAKIPLALNLFSAVCGALTLGLLARTVMILPHDRTEAERVRERSDFGFLTTGSAWFPPLLAVVMLGLQFGFWQNATSFTGESLNLLLFAFVIWQFAEYRLDERLGRIYLATVVYGAGIPDNWALTAFLPVFIAAIIWLRGLEFFNVRFLARMALCGLAGMTLFVLKPALVKFDPEFSVGFWQMLKANLRIDWLVVKSITHGDVRHNLMIMSVTTLLPVLVMAIRWSATFGDNSRIGASLVNYLFHGVHAVIFTVCVWVMFDSPFSPAQLSAGTPALTLYYLSALAIGYYSGYYLLVFGKKAVPTRRNPKPLPALPDGIRFLTPVLYWGTYVAAILAVSMLVYKNHKFIRAVNDDTLLNYAKLSSQNLPAGSGILLSDLEGISSIQHTRTLLMQAALARSGRDKDFLVVDTQSLNWAQYHRYLHRLSPQKWPEIEHKKNFDGVTPFGIVNALREVAKSNTICYLNPSYGYYFEVFYLEPHGLTYQLQHLPDDTLLPPPPSTNLLAANQDFWNGFLTGEFARLQKTPKPRDPNAYPNNAFDWLLMHLHEQSEFNPNVVLVENFYSRSLDYWGVELQRANRLADAADAFGNALKINPDNATASINLEFNRALQTGSSTAINPDRVTPDQFGKYRDWNSMLNANGPFDDPSFVFVNSLMLAQNGYMRQAVAPFERVRQIAPENLTVRLWLAQLYLMNHLPDRALQSLNDPLNHPYRFGLTEQNSAELNFITAAAHFQKNDTQKGIDLIDLEVSRHPDDVNLLTTAAQAYFTRGLYTNALHVIERHLQTAPDDMQWVFSKGFAQLQSCNYQPAIESFTRVLNVATNDPTTLFNRALAYLKTDQLDQARADYIHLQAGFTNSYQVAFGYGEIAWRQRDTNEAVRNYEIYLKFAPTNNPAELQTARDRLKALKR